MQKESTFKKMKELIRHSLSMCTYSATQAYEARKDINRLLSHNGLPTQTIPPPPIFFDGFSLVKKKPHNLYLVKMRSPSVPSFRK
jgi:hypothetical protein